MKPLYCLGLLLLAFTGGVISGRATVSRFKVIQSKTEIAEGTFVNCYIKIDLWTGKTWSANATLTPKSWTPLTNTP